MSVDRLPLTLSVIGKLGPHDVLTEEAVRGLAERIGDDSPIPVRLPNGELRLGYTIPGTVTVVELTPGRYAVKGEAMLRTDDDGPALLAGADAVSAAAQDLLDASPLPDGATPRADDPWRIGGTAP